MVICGAENPLPLLPLLPLMTLARVNEACYPLIVRMSRAPIRRKGWNWWLTVGGAGEGLLPAERVISEEQGGNVS